MPERRSQRRGEVRSMLGEIFFIARTQAGLTQAEAADKAQISQSYLSMIERNRYTPGPDIRARLQQLYAMDDAQVQIALRGRRRCPMP
jgi:transcriptional regulator with XRE-family HTH domain